MNKRPTGLTSKRALHEAGHAVLCWLLSKPFGITVPFASVTLLNAKEIASEAHKVGVYNLYSIMNDATIFESDYLDHDRWKTDHDYRETKKDIIEVAIISCLAGPMVDAIYGIRPLRDVYTDADGNIGYDLMMVNQLVRANEKTTETANQLMDTYLLRTINYLLDPEVHRTIRVFARELLAKHTLTGEQSAAIMEAAYHRN